MSKSLIIAHLYPDDMNIYGDLGNIITLCKRLEWRGYGVRVRSVEAGQRFDWDGVDLVFGGGGQDSGQLLVGPDLLKHAGVLSQMAADGVPMLVVCGLYQLFGHGFMTLEGQEIPGIGIFRAQTVGSTARMIGNVVVESRFGRLVGFENHSGQTKLEPGQEPLGKVTKGFGNDETTGLEGAVKNNAIGTYLHGPVLPKNPVLADHLLLTAVRRRWPEAEFELLDDHLERAAAQVAMARPQ